MRAASDETAMMEQTDPVMVISTAISSAAEHVERARDALRASPRVSADPEATAQADMSRFTALVARAAELEQALAKVEREGGDLRRRLADAEARLAAQHRAAEDEPTNTGVQVPIEFAEHLSLIEESIDSLRANMRAASDETAMMEPTDSVLAVATAVTNAAEHVERARDSLRVLMQLVDTGR
jgi:chromosome segregation ATPase